MKEKQIESEQLDSGEFSDNSQFKHQLNDREDHVSMSNNFDLVYREDEVNSLPESLSNLKLKSESNYYSKFRIYIHVISWLAMTGFVTAALVLQIPKGYNKNLVVLGILYLAASLIFLSRHVTIKNMAIRGTWTKETILPRCSTHLKIVIYAFTTVAIISSIVFGLPGQVDSARVDRLIPFFGFFALLIGLFAMSVHRSKIDWNVVITAALLEFLLGLFVFRSKVGEDIFTWIANLAETFLHSSWYGAEFWFGTTAANAGTLALNILPSIIFFASTSQVLYHYGILQWILLKCGAIFIFIFGISGAESVVTVATPLLGSSDNALLLIKPMIPQLTKSEVHLMLTSGFAVISLSSVYACISMGVSGRAIITSNFMGIPGSILVSKLRYPETETAVSKHKLELPKEEDDKRANDLFNAIARGSEIGMTIALLVLANFISILSILHAVNQFLTWLGNFLNTESLTLEYITGFLFIPFAWLTGVDAKDLQIAGRLIAIKLWVNEFDAYKLMTGVYKGQLSARSELITTFSLCGFANFAYVGVQVGIMNTLDPARKGAFSSLALSTFVCASISNLLSAAIAGMLI